MFRKYESDFNTLTADKDPGKYSRFDPSKFKNKIPKDERTFAPSSPQQISPTPQTLNNAEKILKELDDAA